MVFYCMVSLVSFVKSGLKKELPRSRRVTAISHPDYRWQHCLIVLIMAKITIGKTENHN